MQVLWKLQKHWNKDSLVLYTKSKKERCMIALLTGGAEFIGSHIADKLLEFDHEVILIDNFSLGKEENIAHHKENKKLQLYKTDICSNLDSIFKKHKIDIVFHIAALPRVQFSIKNPVETNNANVNGTLNLLNLCRNYGVKRFVFSSSSSVYGNQEKLPLKESMLTNPLSPYGLQKLIGENYCRLFNIIYGMETISLRYFNVFGPRQDPEGDYACLIPKFIKLMKEEKQPVIYGDGEQTRDFTFVSDVVEANILAATTENKECFGKVFNIGAGKNISVNMVADKISKITESKTKTIHSAPVIEPKHTLADISRVQRYIKWKPKTSFEKGLEITHNYFNK